MSTEEAPAKPFSMDDLVALCKRRGFIFPASEIYGGINGFWDFGPLGVELRNNLRDAWWNDMVRCPPSGPDGKPLSMVGVDTAIIQNPKVWEASGHLSGFTDPLVQCLGKCKKRWREDHLREDAEAAGGDPSAPLLCPECGGELSYDPLDEFVTYGHDLYRLRRLHQLTAVW